MGKKGKFILLRNLKTGQVTIFIIVALVIVIGVVGYFLLRANSGENAIPKEFREVYDYYLSCVDSNTYYGSLLLGQGAGYIENPDFSPGSAYMPFSSQLDFVGMGIPYWFYISGNGLKKEQVPTKEKMQDQLNNFLFQSLRNCDFTYLEQQGFVIVPGEIKNIETSIENKNIQVKINQDLSIIRGNSSWLGSFHTKEVKSNIGSLYGIAKKVYDYEKDNLFLEEYGVDILRLYAPVDGVEISCSPKIWNVRNVKSDLFNALEANVPQIKLKGDYYSLKNKDKSYFVKNIGENVDVNVNLLYSKNWPTKIEIWPSEEGMMKADPVGMQEGLGMLGFCYIPYHFVYDLGYPVLVQLYDDNEEMFQFPIVVYVDKNKPRSSSNVSALPNPVEELCEHKISNKTISTYDSQLRPVDAYITFKCFDTQCNIGRTSTKEGVSSYTGGFPQCVNGFILASAEGYKTKKYLTSGLEENNINIVLDKKYSLDLEIRADGKMTSEYALITFTKDNESMVVAYPEHKTVELTEGQYEIKVYIYSSTNINLEGSTNKKCVSVPKAGILGVFGLNEEKCFDLQIPSQVIDQAVSGGGKQMHYITESELINGNKIIINAEELKTPSKVEDLQINYDLVENTGLDISIENEN